MSDGAIYNSENLPAFDPNNFETRTQTYDNTDGNANRDEKSSDKQFIPEWARNARQEGFVFLPAEHLPKGWGWGDWDDGSGGLYSPEYECVAEYDYATRECKVDGSWSFMGDGGLDRGYCSTN